MFHEGDLQSGIATALQQSKAVFCFIYGVFNQSLTATVTDIYKDDAVNSQAWEHTISTDEQVFFGAHDSSDQ
jgi:hypothetical protein